MPRIVPLTSPLNAGVNTRAIMADTAKPTLRLQIREHPMSYLQCQIRVAQRSVRVNPGSYPHGRFTGVPGALLVAADDQKDLRLILSCTFRLLADGCLTGPSRRRSRRPLLAPPKRVGIGDQGRLYLRTRPIFRAHDTKGF